MRLFDKNSFSSSSAWTRLNTFRCHHEVERRAPHRLSVTDLLERRKQRLLDAENRIGVDVAIVADEDVRDQFLHARRGHHEMHVRRPVRMTSEPLEHLANRAVRRDWIGHRLDTDEAIPAVFAGDEYAAVVPLWLKIGLLDVIEAVGVVGPDVNSGAFNRLSIKVDDHALEQTALALPVQG